MYVTFVTRKEGNYYGNVSLAGPVEMCSLCQSTLTLKEKEHRKLHSDSTEHVLPILLEFSGTLQSSATETIDPSNF